LLEARRCPLPDAIRVIVTPAIDTPLSPSRSTRLQTRRPSVGLAGVTCHTLHRPAAQPRSTADSTDSKDASGPSSIVPNGFRTFSRHESCACRRVRTFRRESLRDSVLHSLLSFSSPIIWALDLQIRLIDSSRSATCQPLSASNGQFSPRTTAAHPRQER